MTTEFVPQNEQEKEFFEMCKAHDLTFGYSDDGRVYRAGHASYQRIQEAANLLPRERAVAIWNAVVDTKNPARIRRSVEMAMIQHPSGIPFTKLYHALLLIGRVRKLDNPIILIVPNTCYNHWELTSLFSFGGKYVKNRSEVYPYRSWYHYLHDAFGFGGIEGWRSIDRHRRMVQSRHQKPAR